MSLEDLGRVEDQGQKTIPNPGSRASVLDPILQAQALMVAGDAGTEQAAASSLWNLTIPCFAVHWTRVVRRMTCYQMEHIQL